MKNMAKIRKEQNFEQSELINHSDWTDWRNVCFRKEKLNYICLDK